ncbi:TPA: hypothetical protein ACRM2N_006189, partial [Pseudomonas aeruginosa]
DHFKHWTLDMTAIYAEDQVRDKELFDEIYVAMRHEKMLVLESVFEEDALVSGGLAETIRIFRSSDEGRRQKLSATPDLSGTVLPLCLIPNSALKSAPPFKSVVPKASACAGLPA